MYNNYKNNSIIFSNSVLMFADIMLVGHPIKMEHAYFTAGLGLSYSIFSLAYFLAGGLNRKNTTEIYPLLDWNKPGKTIVVRI